MIQRSMDLRNEHVTCKEPLEKEQVVAQPDNHLMTPKNLIMENYQRDFRNRYIQKPIRKLQP